MRHAPTSALILGLLLAATACSQRDWDRATRNRGGWNDDWNDRYRNVDDCQRGQGRVNMRKWQKRVDEFTAASFRNKKNFQHAKQQLLNELTHERSKACNWETRRVDDMMSQVRAQRW